VRGGHRGASRQGIKKGSHRSPSSQVSAAAVIVAAAVVVAAAAAPAAAAEQDDEDNYDPQTAVVVSTEHIDDPFFAPMYWSAGGAARLPPGGGYLPCRGPDARVYIMICRQSFTCYMEQTRICAKMSGKGERVWQTIRTSSTKYSLSTTGRRLREPHLQGELRLAALMNPTSAHTAP